MATIQEVLAHAGVSVGSVSRYLKGHQLKPTNIEKIATTIKTLNYQENFLARGLKNKQTRSIGLLMNHVQNQFTATFITTISDGLEKLGYSIVVSALREDASRLKEKLDFLMARQIGRLLLFEIKPTTLNQQYIKALTIPVASINIPLSLFERKDAGDEQAIAAWNNMYQNIAEALYDIQVSIDPAMVIIDGGISARSEVTVEVKIVYLPY